MAAAPESGPIYRFGQFELDAGLGAMRHRGLRVRLGEQPLRVLCLLLSRPGEVVGREELVRALWRDGTHVKFDAGLNAAMRRLRQLLCDRAGHAIYIETVPLRGYRFIAPVQAAEARWDQTPAGIPAGARNCGLKL